MPLETRMPPKEVANGSDSMARSGGAEEQRPLFTGPVHYRDEEMRLRSGGSVDQPFHDAEEGNSPPPTAGTLSSWSEVVPEDSGTSPPTT